MEFAHASRPGLGFGVRGSRRCPSHTGAVTARGHWSHGCGRRSCRLMGRGPSGRGQRNVQCVREALDRFWLQRSGFPEPLAQRRPRHDGDAVDRERALHQRPLDAHRCRDGREQRDRIAVSALRTASVGFASADTHSVQFLVPTNRSCLRLKLRRRAPRSILRLIGWRSRRRRLARLRCGRWSPRSFGMRRSWSTWTPSDLTSSRMRCTAASPFTAYRAVSGSGRAS